MPKNIEDREVENYKCTYDRDFSFLLFKRIPLTHPKASAETAIAREKMFSAIAETILGDAEALKGNAETLKANAEALKAIAETILDDAETLKADAEGLKADAETISGDAEALKAEAETILGAAKTISGEAKIISAQATISFSLAFTAFPANLPVKVEFLRSDSPKEGTWLTILSAGCPARPFRQTEIGARKDADLYFIHKKSDYHEKQSLFLFQLNIAKLPLTVF